MAKEATSEPRKIISLPAGAVRFGPFRFDPTNVTLSRGDVHIHLPPRALGVLEYLARRPGRLVSKDELLEAVWADVHVTEDALTQAVSLIRQALGDDPRDPDYVETVPRVGYRFVAELTVDAPAGTADTTTPLQVDKEILPHPGARPLRSHQGLPWTLAVILLVTVLGIWAWVDSRRARPSSTAPQQQFEVRMPPDAVLPGGGAGASFIAVSPDGSWIAFVAYAEDSHRRLFLRNVNQLDATALPGTDGASVPFFSPDSEWLGYGAEGKLKAIPVRGRAVREICDAPQLRGASWGEDGTILFGYGGGYIARVASSGGEPEVLVSPDPEANLIGLRWPQHLPGGQAALITAQGADHLNADDWRVLILELSSGKIRELLQGATAARYVPTGHLLYLQRSPDYLRAGTLMAAPFDLQRLALTGAGVPVVEGTQIGEGSGAPFYSVSDTGLLLYSPTDPTPPKRQLVWVDRSVNIEPLEVERRYFDGLRLSPDGKRVALEISFDIWVLDLDRNTWNPLTTDGVSEYPVWSPDGESLAYTSGMSDTRQIYQVSASGMGTAEQLTQDLGQFPHDYSADGRMLLYSNMPQSAQWDIFLLPLDGNRVPQPWLQTPNLEVGARVSPDGKWVAYRSNKTGRGEVYVRLYSGPGPAIQISTDGGWRPFWSRDGTELYFVGVSRDQDSNYMMAVPVQEGQDPQFGTAQALFQIPRDLSIDWHHMDVGEDGRFLMIRDDPKETGPLRLVVAPHFFEELKTRVPVEQ